jgi:hypothetical protein
MVKMIYIYLTKNINKTNLFLLISGAIFLILVLKLGQVVLNFLD